MLALLLIAAGAGHGHEPASYGIEPAPLRALIREADLIAVAVPDPSQGQGSEVRTVLSLEKQLKGDIEEERIAVHRREDTMCTTDACFVAGRRTLVFLKLEEGEWRTCALEYGAKILSDEALRVYEARIREYLSFGRLEREHERSQAELDWIVRLAADPLTRWEGASELRDSRAGFAERLLPAQRAGLFEALLSAPRRDAGSMELFELFRDELDPRLTAWMLECLEQEALTPAGWDSEVGVLWSQERLCDPNLSAWVHATWTVGGSGAQKRLYFRGRSKIPAEVRVEEAAAVLEFVERARPLLKVPSAR